MRTDQVALILCASDRKSASNVRILSGKAAKLSCAAPVACKEDATGPRLTPAPGAANRLIALNQFI